MNNSNCLLVLNWSRWCKLSHNLGLRCNKFLLYNLSFFHFRFNYHYIIFLKWSIYWLLLSGFNELSLGCNYFLLCNLGCCIFHWALFTCSVHLNGCRSCNLLLDFWVYFHNLLLCDWALFLQCNLRDWLLNCSSHILRLPYRQVLFLDCYLFHQFLFNWGLYFRTCNW